ncbi:MAG: ABC transporter ATP-binding protein [Desulfurococcaceae archaeon]|jgi:putative ABC transport system ATP-binding protein|nr:ABC transporter ATP-binding protein [Desulfurococcaceae archaeon]
MRKEILVLENIVKVYRASSIETHALRGINLRVYSGDFIAIMGPSGSGKTTLLNIMGLLDKPTSGRVFIDNLDVSKLNSSEMARIRNYKIGFVFQFYNLINRLSVLENIEIPLIPRGIPRPKRVDMATKALLRAAGEISWLPKKPNQLSGGQQQRVAIARAIVGEPEIILADEPTGNLDIASSRIVVKTFQELNKAGATIIVVTHNPEVAHCTQRIHMIRDGLLIGVIESDPSKCILNTAT